MESTDGFRFHGKSDRLNRELVMDSKINTSRFEHFLLSSLEPKRNRFKPVVRIQIVTIIKIKFNRKLEN